MRVWPGQPCLLRATCYGSSPTTRYYLDFTGCGNALNMQSPQVLQLIMDGRFDLPGHPRASACPPEQKQNEPQQFV